MTSRIPSPQLSPLATHGPESALARAVVVYVGKARGLREAVREAILKAKEGR